MIGEVKKMQSYSFFILNSLNNQEYTTGKINPVRFFYFLTADDNLCQQSEPDLVSSCLAEVKSQQRCEVEGERWM